MFEKDFEDGRVYRCTKGNDTFEVGQVVYVDYRDGSLVSSDGWLEKDEIEDAIQGAEFEVDQNYITMKQGKDIIVVNVDYMKTKLKQAGYSVK